jgi:hypothetical protein
LPQATIILGCWLKDVDPVALEALRDTAKADLVAASVGDAMRLCLAAAGVTSGETASRVRDERPADVAAPRQSTAA